MIWPLDNLVTEEKLSAQMIDCKFYMKIRGWSLRFDCDDIWHNIKYLKEIHQRKIDFQDLIWKLIIDIDFSRLKKLINPRENGYNVVSYSISSNHSFICILVFFFKISTFIFEDVNLLQDGNKLSQRFCLYLTLFCNYYFSNIAYWAIKRFWNSKSR